LGSKVSVCAIPPAIQSKITASAEAGRADAMLQPLRKEAVGMLTAIAAALAACICRKNSRRVVISFVYQ
jgi:hypothetical protein